MTRFAASLALALAGLVLFGQGAYIHAKALLAQVLLERAFAETIASGRDIKPWSWADTWPVARIEVQRLRPPPSCWPAAAVRRWPSAPGMSS